MKKLSKLNTARVPISYNSVMKHLKLYIIVALLVAAPLASPASTYDFLSVNSTGTFTSKFTSPNGNGFITATDSFPNPPGPGASENQNNLIFPSTFNTLFPGSGPVQGHLAQLIYGHQSVVTLDLTSYTLSPSTVFGLWNTTDEVSSPTGGNPVYRIQLLDASNVLVNPVTFNLIGHQDNTTQVAARHTLTLNTATGEITPGALLKLGGTHTDAAFFDHIPAGTRAIKIYADLPAKNSIGDGVGYYFAELHQPSAPNGDATFNSGKSDCTNGSLCFDFTLPKLPNGTSGTANLSLELYQNGALVTTLTSGPLTTSGNYCFTNFLSGLNPVAGGFDWKMTAHFTATGTTIPPVVVGTTGEGFTPGKNNDCTFPPPPPGCAQVTGEAQCLSNGGYSYSFKVTNNSGNAISQILLTPVNGSSFTLTPQLTNLSSPLQNGQSTSVTTNIGNVKSGDKVCFFVSLMSEKDACCIVQVCPTLPQCGVSQSRTPPPSALSQSREPGRRPTVRGRRRP